MADELCLPHPSAPPCPQAVLPEFAEEAKTGGLASTYHPVPFFLGEISLLSSFDGRYELATPSSNPYSKENLNKNTPRTIHLENPKGTKTPI